MPLDPSIIANSMTNITSAMPDVSNLMAQRAQGMENIYKIETARQAAAKEEADALQKEQEAAALEALLPAYTYGIETGDIEGALNLAPADMRDGLLPYVDALRGKTPEQVRAALYGSLSASPEGQAALTAIQRGQTYGIQNRQQALAERKYEQELASAGQPKVSFRETDAEGNVRLYDDAGNEIGMLPKAGKPAPAPAAGAGTQEQKMQAREGVDGTLSRIKEQYDILKAEKEIVSSEATAPENIRARIQTKLGPIVGRTVGTKAQTARDTIANLRQALLADIKAATGMSSKAIDSNVELKSFLDSLGDPDQSIETIQNTLAELSIKYGMGGLSAESAEVPTDVGGGPAPEGIPQITSDEEFDALPPGTEFIDPEGVRRRKP